MKLLFNKTFKIFLYIFLIMLVGVVMLEGLVIGFDLLGYENTVKYIINYFNF